MCSWTAKASNNHLVMNRIMLRFRPIAPKPAGGESASGTVEQERGNGAWGRAKRKYVRVRGRQSKRSVRKKTTEGKKRSPPPENSGIEDESLPEKGVVTLQLLPDRSEGDHKSSNNSTQNFQENSNTGPYSNVDDDVNFELTADSGGRTANLRRVGSVIETWIIIESVTDKFTGVGLGFSDKEKIYHLEQDTCPGFISDQTNNVIWVNDAYKKMVAAEVTAAEQGFLVWLVVKEELPYYYPSFACRARLIQHRGHGHKWNKIVPCDVWRMEFAGFAWKLDVNTALSLGV